MYQDIQALKLQVAELASMVKQNTAELKEIKDQVKILNDLLRKSQAADESLRTEINNLPFNIRKLIPVWRSCSSSFPLCRIYFRLYSL